MTNQKIAQTLNQLADLLEFTGANPFRLRAYRNGARVIKDLPESIAAMIEEGNDLTKLDGIGKGRFRKMSGIGPNRPFTSSWKTCWKTFRDPSLDLLNVPHLGPKKAAALFNQLHIETLDQLKAACEAGEVQKLSGFGKKTEQQILDGIAIAAAANERILWAEADAIADRITTHMHDCASVTRFEFAGSYRRGKETVGDLDLLVDSADARTGYGALRRLPRDHVRDRSRRNQDVGTGWTTSFRSICGSCPRIRLGPHCNTLPDPKTITCWFEGEAKQMGLKINEWGVYQVSDDQEVWIAGKSEVDVYETLELPWIEPELREARREIDWALSSQLPDLVTLDDICGDLHMHTIATDGKASIQEMADAARERGLCYIAITDHSQRVAMANGLDPSRAIEQWQQIDKINRQAENDFIILKGIECDILENGEMDLDNETLAQADFVIASVHYGQNQPRQQITDRIIGALENPHVSMIAHPTGRLLNKREPYDVDLDAVFQAAVENGKLLELNANPMRLDLNDVQLAAAKSLKIPIVINTDAHRIAGLDNMQYGIKQARRGGLTADDVANTRSLEQFLELLGKS